VASEPLEAGISRQGAAAPASAERSGVAPAFRASLAERAVQAFLALVLAAGLAAGFLLVPSSTGTGTHRILGLPECGMLRATGKPCPTCGVTTSFVLAAHGRLAEAVVNQPFGFALFLLVAGCLAGLVFALATGRSWYPVFVRVNPVVMLLALLGLLLASWAYKWSVM